MSGKKWVYLFDEVEQAEKYVGGNWDGVRALLGGKGANLAEMTRIGVPVPPGFTVTTEACNAYLAEGEQVPRGYVGAGAGSAQGRLKHRPARSSAIRPTRCWFPAARAPSSRCPA